jgi:hypothetical protein
LAGLLPNSRFKAFVWCLAAAMVALTAFTAMPSRTARADCVFPIAPTSYEALRDRQLFLDTIELAAFNMLFPGDPYFGLPDLQFGPRNNRQTKPGKVPPTLLKAISWVESSITQTGGSGPWGSIGPALVSFDCGHGITQVTSGMTAPLGEAGRATPEQALVATHFAYNVARGAWILADKWNNAPENRPIAGIDTNGLPDIVENWYFAVWSYNGFTGPGANRSNHPLDPIYGSWPRTPYSCGPANDGLGHNRANYPYQEMVFGCAAHPPVIDGKPLWQGMKSSLPDLNDPRWRVPLGLTNFIFPYIAMDMPTPQPFSLDTTPMPDPALRQKILGSPRIQVETNEVKLGYSPDGGGTVEVVEIKNAGTGLLAWYAVASEPWVTLRPYTGVAGGPDLPCDTNEKCDLAGKLEISIDGTKVPPGTHKVAIRVQALGTNQVVILNLEVKQVVRIGAPGVVKTGQ